MGMYECKICYRRFRLLDTLNKHIHVCKCNINKFKCHSCSKTFRKNSILQEHLQTHIPIKDRNIKCHICQKNFSSSIVLKKHLKIHTEGKTDKCNVCEKTFINKKCLKSHLDKHTIDGILQYHSKSQIGFKKFTCEMCGTKGCWFEQELCPDYWHCC